MIRSCVGLTVAAVAFQVLFSLDSTLAQLPRKPYPQVNPERDHNIENMHPYKVNHIPRHCWAPPPGISLYECCPIPPLYPDSVMEECGIEKPNVDEETTQTIKKDENCTKGTCLMLKSDLLRANKSIDLDRMNDFIDQYAYAHPNFTQAILVAKKICLREGVPAGPPKVDCIPDKLLFCMTAHIIWNCNLRVEFEACQILKEHIDECRPYYAKPKRQENVERIRRK